MLIELISFSIKSLLTFSFSNNFSFNLKDKSIILDFIEFIIVNFSFSISSLAQAKILFATNSASAKIFSLFCLAKISEFFSSVSIFSFAS
jgi:hypothetical protein